MQSPCSGQAKRFRRDIIIIGFATFLALTAYLAIQDFFRVIMADTGIPVLLRTLFAAVFQFGVAGFGISLVALYRKEPFTAHGLRVKGSLLSIALCVLCFVPYIIFQLFSHALTSYLPFQTVWTTKEVLAAGFPANLVGMLIIAVFWGFFEGFNYVVISDIINRRFPSDNIWLNWGAICCAVFCVLIHGAVGVTPAAFLEMLAAMFIIYGMLVVKETTGNAWGCVFIFVFLWNAL